MAQQATKRAVSRGPKVQKVYGLTSMCQVCKRPIRPGHTWKFTEQGGKVHYYCAEQNPAGPTFSQAMVAARQAGARIGDTSGFEPWLVKQKLDARGPQILDKLRAEFWKGVETGEAPKESATPKQIYHGARIRKTAAGWITNIDPASVFDDLRQVKQFVDAQQRNPQLTDRAYRYRANANPPDGPKQCAFCGTKQQIQIGHVDGHEENGEPENLIWTCRSCNMLHANTLRAAGYGRLTRQYNPVARGAESYRQYALAVDSIQRRDKKDRRPHGLGWQKPTDGSRSGYCNDPRHTA